MELKIRERKKRENSKIFLDGETKIPRVFSRYDAMKKIQRVQHKGFEETKRKNQKIVLKKLCFIERNVRDQNFVQIVIKLIILGCW